jgi:hypothetical protein
VKTETNLSTETLSSLKVSELQELLTKRGIEFRKKATKKELIDLIVGLPAVSSTVGGVSAGNIKEEVHLVGKHCCDGDHGHLNPNEKNLRPLGSFVQLTNYLTIRPFNDP